MTDSEYTLSVSNAALSGLLYDCCNNEADQIGFLIGKTSQVEKTVTTDTQEPSIQINTCSDVYGTLPLPPFSFYNAGGIINEEQVTELMGHLKENVIGWYICRRNSVDALCVRERLIDRQLRELLKETDSKYFIVGLITETKDENQSTFNIQYKFFSRVRNRYIPVQVEVDNLAKTDLSFKKSSAAERFDMFNKLRIEDAYKVGMPKFLEGVQGEVDKHFNLLVSQFLKSEKEISDLKNKIKSLQPDSSEDCQLKNEEFDDDDLSDQCTGYSSLTNSKSPCGNGQVSNYNSDPYTLASQEY